MNKGLIRKCCCPVCDCGEDCNGTWGLPNEDKAFQCCWSVGDRVLYRHTWGGSYTVRSGGSTLPLPCHPASYNCGIVKYSGGTNIEVEYVCIGARGNYHDPIIDPRLPEFINGKSWEGEPVPSPTGDGYNISPIVYNISPNQSYNDPPTKTDYQELKTLEGEYVINNAHVPGCANGWNYRYYDKYDGFEVVETINGLEYTYSWEPKLKNTDDIEISLKETFCGTIADCLSPFNKTVNICKQEESCGEDDIVLPESCWVKNTDGDFERIKCDPNSPCSCYGIDEQGNVFGKNEYKLFQHATIFALDLTNPNIQYCSQNGYWIEQEIEKKWAKYELSPYLVLFNRPMIEWQCDCKDTDDEYILKDGVGPSKKREVYGGFSWYGWNGNCSCSGDNCCASNFKSLAPCVQRCLSLVDEYAAGNGLVPCASVIADGQPEGPNWQSFRDLATITGYGTADFFNCQNCTEAVASCSGFKSYCVIRDTNMPKCPGDCQSFYGVMESPDNCSKTTNSDCSTNTVDIEQLQFGCSYGCAEEITCACENYTPFCQTFSPKDSGLLIFPDPYARTECQTYTTHILTITPVEEDSRRCNWYQWEGIDNDGTTKEYRCCGSAGRSGGRDIGETIPITNPYGNITFSWSEGIGWVSTCEDLGKVCGGFYYDGPSEEDINASGGGYAPDIICNEGNGCGSVQCSGTTSWLSYTEIGSGDYPCYLGTTQRACCQLPESIACGCEWWPNSTQKSYEPKYWREEQIPNLDEYWNLQINISNMSVIVGCTCTPPSCGCEGPGNYTENSGTICNLDNYTAIASRINCASKCYDYVADTWNCKYTPFITAGTQAFCPQDPCPDPRCPNPSCEDNKCPEYCCGSCMDDVTGNSGPLLNECSCDGCGTSCPSGSTWVSC
jgi:hypothetical protein